MKKSYFIVIIFCSIVIQLFKAQPLHAATYNFTGSSPADPFPTVGTTTNVFVPATLTDDWDTLIKPSGFNFNLEGTTYTGFIVSTNGWIALATAGTNSIPPYFSSALPNNSLTTYSGGLPLFAPLWDDNSANLISYNYAAGTLNVRWNMKWDKNYSGSPSALIWMSLNTSTGEITFNYSNTTYIPSLTASASIGITGFCTGTFYSVTPDNIPANSTVSTSVEDSVVIYKPVDAKYVFTPVSSSLSWQGTADTLYDNSINWGGSCLVPNCMTDAIIGITVSGNMPTVTSDQSVRDLQIDSGASIRIMAPYTLSICGNLVNNGTFIAEPGSAISFTGSGVQTISGSFTGSNSFADFNIAKPSGSVILDTDIDVNLNFSMNNNSAALDVNSHTMKVGGNFNSYSVNSTGGGMVEFNGSSNQFFMGHGTQLNNVKVNKAGGKIYLTGSGSHLVVDSILSLVSGIVVTGLANEVSILLASPNAIQFHSANSYIDGQLRRTLFFGSVDFPVGDSLVINQGLDNGYELANINFQTMPDIPDLKCVFLSWSGSPPHGPAGPDPCGYFDYSYDSLLLYNNGYWYFENTSTNINGEYDVTLYNTGGLPDSTTQSYTVATSPISFNPNLTSSWNLIGSCDTTSVLHGTRRNLLNNISSTSTAFNHIYTTAQGMQGTPVSINDPESGNEIILFPNPLTESTILNILTRRSENAVLKIRTMTGRLIEQRTVSLNAGENKIHLGNYSEGISPGVYMLSVDGEHFRSTIRLMVK